MKAMLLAVGVVLSLSGLATATEDESAFTIDLTGGNRDSAVHAYHIACQYGTELNQGCGQVSVWEEVNGVVGLQKQASIRVEKPDHRLTP